MFWCKYLLIQCKTIQLKKIRFGLLLLVFLLPVAIISAQIVTGEWYGVGQVKRTGNHNSYLSEMILKQTGTQVSGEFNYFFRDVEIKTSITGTYDSKSKTLLLNTSPVLNFQAKNANGADCPMEGLFSLVVSGKQTFLWGQFNATNEYRLTCPSISVKFAKSTDKPKPSTFNEEVYDTVKLRPIETRKKLSETEILISKLNKRSFDVLQIIDVDADSLKVSLYDLGEVDNDTISVFYNRKPVANRQMLSDKPMTFTLPVDTNVNELSMFAENLGRFPPNTALAIIYAGEKRFEFSMTSTFIKNAAIRFRRKPRNLDPKNIN